MKKFALFCTALGSAFSYSCFAQGNTKTQLDLSSQNNMSIAYYHVEERINMNFGGSIRTYDVTNLDMITPKDLGKDNVRIITPKYAKVKAKAVAVEVTGNKAPKITLTPIQADVQIAKSNFVMPKETKDYVIIDVVDTYERIMDKGYKSVVMLTKVADRHFFNGDYTLAAKWYTELFASTKDLEAVYYYRYAQSLMETGQKSKGEEMMKIFETKSL